MRILRQLIFAVILIGGAAAALYPVHGLARELNSWPDRAVEQLETAAKDLERYGVLGVVLRVEGAGLEPMVITQGYADSNQTIPIDADRTFLIASQSKMFTAASILLLADAGQLDIDDKVSKYLPEFGEGRDITIRQLLTHQSGIGDGSELLAPPRPMARVTVDFDDLLMMSRLAGTNFKPGERYAYNNSGYAFLGEIIDRASGVSRAEFIRKNILEPLGMSSTYIGGQESWPLDRMARGYEWDDLCECPQATHNPPDLSWASGAGDMISNAGDMMKWLAALQDPNNPTGLSLADYRADVVAVNEPGVMNAYGLGVSGQMAGGLQLWGHGGSINGYFSVSMIEPESGLRATILMSLEGQELSTAVYRKTVHAMLDMLTAAMTWGRAEATR